MFHFTTNISSVFLDNGEVRALKHIIGRYDKKNYNMIIVIRRVVRGIIRQVGVQVELVRRYWSAFLVFGDDPPVVRISLGVNADNNNFTYHAWITPGIHPSTQRSILMITSAEHPRSICTAIGQLILP